MKNEIIIKKIKKINMTIIKYKKKKYIKIVKYINAFKKKKAIKLNVII